MRGLAGRLRTGWAAGVLAFGAGGSGAVAAFEPVLPWAEGEAGRVEESPSGGRLRYVWPPVRDEYLRVTPLKEITAWVRQRRSEQARALAHARGSTGDVISISNSDPAPLSLAQWDALAGRAAHDLRLGDADLETDAQHMLALLTGLPKPEEEPLTGHRAAAEEALRWCASDRGGDWRGLPYMTADLAARAGDTGFVRRVATLARQTPDQRARARLAEAIAASDEFEHDLNKAELMIVGGELLKLAGEPGLEPRQRITLASAAMRLVGGIASVQLIDQALASEHEDIRRAAFSAANRLVRQARTDGDPGIETALIARLDRFMEGMNDPDKRVASSAVATVQILLEGDPEAAVDMLIVALNSPNPAAASTACMYLMEFPARARAAMPTLRKLAASQDRELKLAAIELLNAIESAD